jgi:hypothetical protein
VTPSQPLSAVCLLPRSGRTGGDCLPVTGTPRLAHNGEAGPFLIIVLAAQNPFQGLGRSAIPVSQIPFGTPRSVPQQDHGASRCCIHQRRIKTPCRPSISTRERAASRCFSRIGRRPGQASLSPRRVQLWPVVSASLQAPLKPSPQRLKGIRGWVSDRLESGVINAAEHEIQRWQHVREMARKGGNDARAGEAEKVLAALLPFMKGDR